MNPQSCSGPSPKHWQHTVHDGKKPPFNGPLIIHSLQAPFNTVIGLTHCPGRSSRNTSIEPWNRSLIRDFKSIETWGADILISLNQASEFDQLGVPEFPDIVKRQKFRWYHLPIDDFSAPGEEFTKAWNLFGAEILGYIENGSRIVLHCAAGLGRSGTFAAKLLTTYGWDPLQAIDLVRKTRPGAIERKEQERYIIDKSSLKTHSDV